MAVLNFCLFACEFFLAGGPVAEWSALYKLCLIYHRQKERSSK